MGIIPVILCGGTGSRLWPVSHSQKPKQFLKFGHQHSLFQQSVLRCRSKLFSDRPIVVGARENRFLIAEQLLCLGTDADILLEPARRNSCAAIAIGCFQAMTRDRNAMILVAAADHIVTNGAAFRAAITRAVPSAASARLVVFGARPRCAATAFGYIAPGKQIGDTFDVDHFVEKPPVETARHLIEQGYLWNTGNFLFRADAFLDELENCQPEIHAAARRAMEARCAGQDFIRPDATAFCNAPAISVDFAVFEKTRKAALMPVDYEWADIGSWQAVWENTDRDSCGNAVYGSASLLESGNNIVHSGEHHVALLGMDDTIIVAFGGYILVAPRERSEEIGRIVEFLSPETPAGAGQNKQGRRDSAL